LVLCNELVSEAADDGEAAPRVPRESRDCDCDVALLLVTSPRRSRILDLELELARRLGDKEHQHLFKLSRRRAERQQDSFFLFGHSVAPHLGTSEGPCGAARMPPRFAV
jgi:hypothetical protein